MSALLAQWAAYPAAFYAAAIFGILLTGVFKGGFGGGPGGIAVARDPLCDRVQADLRYAGRLAVFALTMRIAL